MKNRWNYLLIAVPFVILLIVGSFFDFEINKALYSDPFKNGFGLTFSAIMPAFSYLFMSFSGGYILNFFLKEKNWFLKLFFLAAVLGSIGTAIYYTADKYPSVNAFNNEKLFILGFVVAILFHGSIFFLGYKVSTKNEDKRILWAMIAFLITCVIVLVPVTQITKNIMRRPRYRTMVEDTIFYFEESEFLPWYTPFNNYDALELKYGHDIVSENFKSFPSGHVCEAAITIFGLPIISKLFPKLENKETLFTSIGLVFTLLMALSRMTMGAHYLTDVAMGALLMVIFGVIQNEIVLKLFLNKERS